MSKETLVGKVITCKKNAEMELSAAFTKGKGYKIQEENERLYIEDDNGEKFFLSPAVISYAFEGELG